MLNIFRIFCFNNYKEKLKYKNLNFNYQQVNLGNESKILNS